MRSMVLQQYPRERSEREKLRDKGQFWTPDWVARAMVQYVIEGSNLVFDPALGKGAFFTALKAINRLKCTNVKFYGTDIDSQLVEEMSKENCDSELCRVELRDFIKEPPKELFSAIVANPPYIRHHRLPEETKKLTRRISLEALGKTLDGRAGIHIYFLIQALRLLEPNGKLAFIMPSDTCEGIFASSLWHWITSKYCLDCVVAFSPEATPFPEVDTNPVIFMIKNTHPKRTLVWVRVNRAGTEELSDFVSSGFSLRELSSLTIVERNMDEALTTGLSRDPRIATTSKYQLSHFATVMRGIATGANDFFFLTAEEAAKRKIPSEFLLPAVGRTRDVDGFYITEKTMERLRQKGRPTLLFAPDTRSIEEFTLEVQQYLHEGERKGLPARPLISSRKPWYRMERRAIPPFLFAYLGRRNARFIRNLANVVPLTGFLCVYPLLNSHDYIDKLWDMLQHPDVLRNLSLIGKSYGSGAIKIEPRALERLPIPETLVDKLDICPIRSPQISMPV